MAFDTRTRAEIRDSLLSDWSTRYAANGRVLDTSANSDAYMLAEALAVELELFEQQASSLDKEILPDQASYSLTRHGNVDGMTQNPAVTAILAVGITGTALATVTYGSATLSAADGTAYTPSTNSDGTGTSVVLDGSGKANIYVTAQVAAAAGTKALNTILTWSSAPANANPTASVQSTFRAGLDLESNAAFAARILARRQNRPASGNRADWQAWCTSYTGVTVADAVVYPLLHPTYGTGTLGAVTVVPLGPAQGTAVANTRILSAGTITSIGNYIEGTVDVNGVATTTGVQLRPVTMAAGDYTISAAIAQTQAVELQVVLATAYASPWPYNVSYGVLASPTPTTTTFSIAGNLTTVLANGSAWLPVLVNVGTANYRGGFYKVTPTSVSYDGVNTNIVVPTLPGAPVTPSVMLPGLPNWTQFQTAIFNLFDTLGPGDTSPASRWPTEEVKLRSKLYVASLISAVTQTLNATGTLVSGVPGVLSCTTILPGADVGAAAKNLISLSTLSVHT